VLTDAAFTELRYGGRAAACLRGIKAFLLSVPINCIGIGYAFLALRKVAESLGVVDGHIVFAPFTDTILLMILVALFLLLYTVLGGLWAVVVNDFVQLVLALLGAFAVCFVALEASGGMTDLLAKLEALDRPEASNATKQTANAPKRAKTSCTKSLTTTAQSPPSTV
jgi:Na+/proline symporter